ncbi:MAG: M23 family metallopeptidase [Azoarcus sp.]|nr:M23 family metallopeptidase [Azoarcus sp.]
MRTKKRTWILAELSARLSGLSRQTAIEMRWRLDRLRWRLARLHWRLARLDELRWRLAEPVARLHDRLIALPERLFDNTRAWVVGGFAGMSVLGGVTAATAVATPEELMDTRTVVEALAVAPENLPAPNLPFVHDDRVTPGDTAQSIFHRLNIDDPKALAFVKSNKETARALRQLRTGRSLTAVVDVSGRLLTLRLPLSQSDGYLVIERNTTDQSLQVFKSSGTVQEAVTEMRSGVIKHSLFAATEAAGLPDSIATQFADLFGTEVDFHSDLRRGDTFSVIYEAFYDRGLPTRAGRILAAEFTSQGKRHSVFLHTSAKGHSEYYSGTGQSLRGSFLRSPLEFSKVTSNFGGRMHPVLRNWRNHRGVDFGAPTGTPVRATSDGTVSFIGTQRGYGNIIVLRHRGAVNTAYAHLSAFSPNLRTGDTVEQGETIGRVGATGRVTGPHLHYEVRIDGVAHDPLIVALPGSEPLAGEELTRFRANVRAMYARLALLDYRFASNDDPAQPLIQ